VGAEKICPKGELLPILASDDRIRRRRRVAPEKVMPDDVRRIYEAAGLLRYYFDEKVPRDLFRGQRWSDARQGLPVLRPDLGRARKDGTARLPDVKIVEQDGKQVVKGCRCIKGDYRGLSTFDRKDSTLGGFKWHRLPKSTDIPVGLAITQDSDRADRPNHFTIAPKDDMPIELFQVWLNAFASQMIAEE
jgi:hypothetical protein